MAFKYPISSQWITFPTDLKAHALIEWKENRLNHRDALYYHVKCFWGDLKIQNPKDGSDATKYHADRLAGRLGTVFTGEEGKINIVGTTKLYVAQEYVEMHYANGPLERFHIKDLAKHKVKAPTASRLNIEKEEVAPWITMQLNENFHYGVEGSKGRLRRWIVYHPPASEGISPPGMYQHRFTGLPKSEFLNAVASDMESAVPKEYKFAAKLGSKAIALTTKALAAKYGDPLHQFLNKTAVQTARASMDKFKVISVMRRPEVSERAKELIAVQVFELDKIIVQLEDCQTALQNQKPDKEYELELRNWIKNNQQDLKTIYAAMEAEMGRGRTCSSPIDPGQPGTSSVPDPSSTIAEVVGSREKAQLFTTQFVINMEIDISDAIGAPKATATIKAYQEEMKSTNPKPSLGQSKQPIASEYGFQELVRDRPTPEPGAPARTPRDKKPTEKKSVYYDGSQNNNITRNVVPKYRARSHSPSKEASGTGKLPIIWRK